MMFDKELFLSLCEKYNVELSSTAVGPMIREGQEVRAIAEDDVKRIFAPCHTFFGYSGNLNSTRIDSPKYYLEDYAIAC